MQTKIRDLNPAASLVFRTMAGTRIPSSVESCSAHRPYETARTCHRRRKSTEIHSSSLRLILIRTRFRVRCIYEKRS